MRLEVEIAGRLRSVLLEAAGTPGQWRCQVDGRELIVDAQATEDGILSLLVAGRSFRAVLENHGEEAAIHIAGRRYQPRSGTNLSQVKVETKSCERRHVSLYLLFRDTQRRR